MRSSLILVATVVAAMAASHCGGDGSTPTSPGPTSSVVAIAIVGLGGSGSYQPNPVSTSGNQVMFRNDDKVNTHHIVMDDGSADFGSLAPGGSTAPKTIPGGNFHCANHPSMVGSINGASAPVPPAGSGDGY